jgi:copper chaperone CopZ
MKKTVKIEGMSCSHCAKAVKDALSEVAGVTGVEVDLDAKYAEVTSSAEVANDALTAAVVEAGYEVVGIA